MAALSDYLENKLIDAVFRAVPYTPPATMYVGLFTTNTNDANLGGIEVTGGNYSRAGLSSSMTNWAGTQGAGSTTASSGTSGTTSNNTTITFPTPSAAWGTITGFGVFDGPTGGNLLFYSSLTANKVVGATDPAPSFAAGQLTFQLDN